MRIHSFVHKKSIFRNNIMNVSKIDASSGDERPDLLSSFEVESYIEAIGKSKILELGCLSWLDKHERIKQLAIQSVIQALSNREEIVKECLITFEKIPVLVHDLILVELWKERVFPELLKSFQEAQHDDQEESGHCGFALYPILYHESSIINLLETVLFHSSAVETLNDASLDLADYCLRSLTSFLTVASFDMDEEDGEELKRKCDTTNKIHLDLKTLADSLSLGCALKSLTCLRYLIENLDSLGHGLTSRLVVSTDTPMLLTELIVQKPWRREYWKSGKIMELDPGSCGQWKEIDPSARNLISNTEAQAWLSLYLLLKNNSILSTYELYESRKNALLKLRPFLNERTLDQIPILGEMHRFINQLAVSPNSFSAPSKSPLLLELVPVIRSELEMKFDQEKDKILTHFRQEFVTGSRELMMEKAKRLVTTYDLDSFTSVLPQPHKCSGDGCEKDGCKKCGRCKEVWYCGKECQVSDWKMRHRDECVPKSC